MKGCRCYVYQTSGECDRLGIWEYAVLLAVLVLPPVIYVASVLT